MFEFHDGNSAAKPGCSNKEVVSALLSPSVSVMTCVVDPGRASGVSENHPQFLKTVLKNVLTLVLLAL